MIAKFRHEMYFADFLGRKKYRFFEQHYKQMMPTQIQSHPSVCSFYSIYVAFHRINFCQEEFTRLQTFIVLRLINNYIDFFNSISVNMQSMPGICSNWYSLIYFSDF